MSDKTILVWFRNDLRIHDNEILLEATRKADKIIPVYCFDPYYFNKNLSGNSKTGNIRARFLLESVADLKKNLQNIGGELVIRIGDPAEILPQLAQQYQVNEVYHHREVAFEETNISERVEAALWKIKLNLKHFIGHTMYHKEDLPFPIKDIPDSFATFKKKVERDSTVRPPIKTPDTIKTPLVVDSGELPSLENLGLTEPLDDSRSAFQFKGGETEGLRRLNDVCSGNGQSEIIKGARNVYTDADNSSKLSAWISLGCISAREVYRAILDNQSSENMLRTNQVILDLLWRDYFRFMFKKHGQKFIAAKSTGETSGTSGCDQLFESWKNGETGIPLIDAIMHKLNATGYITNYGRQIVAGYLINELKIDWVKGAAYFEEKLIDYSPASNWGNWAFLAGVNNPLESRYAIVAKATNELETKSDFIKTWLPSVKVGIEPSYSDDILLK